MKGKHKSMQARVRALIKRLRRRLTKKPGSNANKAANKEQRVHAAILLVILAASVGFYRGLSNRPEPISPQEDTQFAGGFDTSFNKQSDEALIEQQQHAINALQSTFEAHAKKMEAALKERKPETETRNRLQALQDKLTQLEQANQTINEQLQVALTMNVPKAAKPHPPTREEQAAHRLQRQQATREVYRNAGLETVRLTSHHQPTEEHTANNYVWAGSFFEGVMLTGLQGDAGINGAKNMGTALIRITSDGIMPNEQRSHLAGCFVLVSSYGDLSASSIVLHVETVSCAGHVFNFEQKAYGAVFDMDAMQDLRGTSILKTKPLLGYSAAAGMLAGFGDGLKNLNTTQSLNPGAGTMTTFGGASALAQSAGGGALSNPANRISDYIMKIADIYHPLVVARAGRHVSVLFTKGFWIDKEHQVYESQKALDETHAQTESNTTASRPTNESINALNMPSQMSADMRQASIQPTDSATDFMQSTETPLFSTPQPGVTPHE